MKQSGFTMIELIIVVSIIAILILAGAFQFMGWIARYKVEAQTKDMYTDLMTARSRAMQRNMTYLVELAATSYTICEDTNNNGVCDNPAETTANISRKLSKPNPRYQMNWGFGGGLSRITMDRRGVSTPNGSIWLLQPDGTVWAVGDVDYDCVVISETRINMGKWDGANCQAR